MCEAKINGYVTVRLTMWFKTTIPVLHRATHRCGLLTTLVTDGLHQQLSEALSQEAPASHTPSASGLSAEQFH